MNCIRKTKTECDPKKPLSIFRKDLMIFSKTIRILKSVVYLRHLSQIEKKVQFRHYSQNCLTEKAPGTKKIFFFNILIFLKLF